jgi:ribosomal protein S18 acetylase RimI-like enzyme
MGITLHVCRTYLRSVARSRRSTTVGEPEVRILVPDDAPALVALRREALETHPQAFGASPDDDRGLSLSIDFARGALDPAARERAVVFGLFDGGALAGMVGVARATEHKRRHRGQLWGMYVAPGARRKGGGRALLEAAIAHARAWPGVTSVHLCVSASSSSALQLYRSLGFREWGRDSRALAVEGVLFEEHHMSLVLAGEPGPPARAAQATAPTEGTRIVARVARALEAGDVVEGLARRLPPSDLQSLLLHVFRERSARRTPADLLAQYERTPALRPSAVGARALRDLESAAFESAAGFEAIELAPVAPVGVNMVLGGVDQNNALAATRGAEALADPTTLQALECARRRRAGDEATIRLCSRSRPLRLQPTDVPWFTPHFALFSMVSAGRDRGSYAFELESLGEHLRVHLLLLRRLAREGYALSGVDVAIADTAHDRRRLGAATRGVLEPLAAEFPEARFRVDEGREQGMSYYSGLCLRIDAAGADGTAMNLADGGFTDWTRRLLSNAKERLLVSGIGVELLAKLR